MEIKNILDINPFKMIFIYNKKTGFYFLKIALEAFDYTSRILGIKLADAVAHTSPEAIILFGGLALAGDLIFVPTKKYMEENLFHVFKNKVKIIPSGLQNYNAAVLGAGALIRDEILKSEKLSVFN